MTTLLAVYTKEGCIGRCDAKCYDANSPECDCICGGVNHGVGLRTAVLLTRNAVDDIAIDYAVRNPKLDYDFFINATTVNQLWFPFIDEEE